MNQERLEELLKTVMGKQAQTVCFAPGRVNLIGEHTDYNGGYVFPCAIDAGILCAGVRRSDRRVRLFSTRFAEKGVAEDDMDSLRLTGEWSDYPKAMMLALSRFGYELPYGADLVYDSDLPDGAGLSSSAAIEIVTGAVLRELFDLPLTGQVLALAGQFAENQFIGVQCGIMDQFASSMGREDHALLLNTRTLEYTYAPLPADKIALVLVNSGVRHSLAAGAYNERRQQCEDALAALKKVVPAASLCALSPAQFRQYADAVRDEQCRKRARHAVSENERTRQAVSALNTGDYDRFGALMKQSHCSLRDDYEVSCEELDFLAGTAWTMDGVYGARMTGGGFGGCTVNLVKPEYAGTFARRISAAYEKRYGMVPGVYAVRPGQGQRKLKDVSCESK